MKKTKLTILILLILGLTNIQAQETVLTTGGDATGSDGSMSYSVGQIVYTTNTGTNGYVLQGIQQPFEITTTLDIKEIEGINLKCSIYPNPTPDNLILEIDEYDNKEILYQLYNFSGKLIESKKLKNNRNIITMKDLVPSTYFLKVISNQKEIKTFKIIKN